LAWTEQPVALVQWWQSDDGRGVMLGPEANARRVAPTGAGGCALENVENLFGCSGATDNGPWAQTFATRLFWLFWLFLLFWHFSTAAALR